MMVAAHIEQEANIFALYLLMPPELWDAHVARGFDPADDQWLSRTAKKFRVPLAAVAARVALDTDIKGEFA